MDFRNDNDVFDFTELPSAYGTYGGYGTNHLENEWNKGFAQGMIQALEDVRSYLENEIDKDADSVLEKLKNEIAAETLDDLIDMMTGEIAMQIVSMGDEEACDAEDKEEHEDEKSN